MNETLDERLKHGLNITGTRNLCVCHDCQEECENAYGCSHYRGRFIEYHVDRIIVTHPNSHHDCCSLNLSVDPYNLIIRQEIWFENRLCDCCRYAEKNILNRQEYEHYKDLDFQFHVDALDEYLETKCQEFGVQKQTSCCVTILAAVEFLGSIQQFDRNFEGVYRLKY